ncbi:SAC3/GANP/Nin1/mts3/eIF-3 p25 [Penicillium bovifimosum]|uniref:SAC3/GANP/Nin1/mts3/eIF-3 p25 n=1 Tax=Penicillium bovifimosum TaxID=126998 RepID=A0A9W9H011_9EURO|nr:SAC3/GANP/Nin1/mts3/eIF-3 p25 [Penicillium bovifimosum]KAJ5135114.1 SAC3/GANP/Nin1/mts3/eIF-3 p25 [Penicillium bovifimosum]
MANKTNKTDNVISALPLCPFRCQHTCQHMPGKMSRLRPVSDSLENLGFVSKGDKKLLDHKTQTEYFDKIVDRYMRFCARHSKDLDAALTSLPTSRSNDATSNPPASRPMIKSNSAQKDAPPPSAELSTLLLSLRKLREAVLATAKHTPPEFSQRVHNFSIRLSILAHHPPSYFPSLRYVVDKLHSISHPLPDSEVKEMLTYLILDYACRQDDMISAFELRARARKEHAFKSQIVDKVLTALIHDNWVMFWQLHNSVDSHIRAVMNWAADRVRRHALKAVGSAYISVHISWILGGCTGDEQTWTWEKLVEQEKLRWERIDDKVIIKRPRQNPPSKAQPSASTA